MPPRMPLLIMLVLLAGVLLSAEVQAQCLAAPPCREALAHQSVHPTTHRGVHALACTASHCCLVAAIPNDTPPLTASTSIFAVPDEPVHYVPPHPLLPDRPPWALAAGIHPLTSMTE